MRDVYRAKIKLTTMILNKFAKRKDMSRTKLCRILQAAYKKYGVKPFKGKATPHDLYDKELATLYVLGKYGLKLEEEYNEFFDQVFYIEKILDTCVDLLLIGEFDKARELLRSISPSNVIDSNSIARLLRIPFTKLVFGFITEEDFAKIINNALKAFPDEERSVKNFVRFYIAYRVAEEIAKGRIKDWGFKEALKKALAIRLNLPKTLPDDEYIRTVAKEMFNVDDDRLNKIFQKQINKSNKTP